MTPECGQENAVEELDAMFTDTSVPADLATDADQDRHKQEIVGILSGHVCPACGGRVRRFVCEACGWDEFGGNVFYGRAS